MHTQAVEKHFSRASKTYEHFAAVQSLVASDLLFQIRAYHGSHDVIEIGSGSGILTEGLRTLFGSGAVTALDVSEAMLRRLAQRTTGVVTIHSNIEEFETDRRFDLAVSSSALQWTDLARSLSAIRGALRNGGDLCAAVMIQGTLTELRTIRETLYPELAPEADLPSAEEVIDALKESGFELKWTARKNYTERHQTAWELLKSLRSSGVTGGKFSRGHRSLRRTELQAIAAEYDRSRFEAGLGLPASYEVIFFGARK